MIKYDKKTLIIFILLLIIPLSYGLEYNNVAHSYPPSINDGSDTIPTGHNITVNNGDFWIRNAYKTTNEQSTQCHLYRSYDLALLSNGAVVGNNCTFNPIVQLNETENYFIVFDSGGSSRTRYRASSSFPQTTGNVTWNAGGYYWGGIWYNTVGTSYSIVSIDIAFVEEDEEEETPNQDSIAISSVKNATTNSTIYFNWTVVGNYSYSYVYQGGVLLYNGSNQYYTQTSLSNNTAYAYNLSVYWNTSLYNSSNDLIFTTNQTIQWSLNDLQTYLDLQALKEEYKMIWIVLLWTVGTLGGIWLFHKRMLFAGLSLYMISIVTDFIISGEIYTNFIGNVSTTTVFGFSYGLAITLLALWIPFKAWLGYAVYNKI